MTEDHKLAHRPLPVVLKPVADELLSSWLVRHAAYYGVTGSFFAQWLMLGTRNLSALDHRLGLAQVARLSEKPPLRSSRPHRDDVRRRAGPIRCVDLPGQGSANFSNVPRSACARGRLWRGPETLAESLACHLPRLWRAPIRDTNERPDASETLRDTSPFGCLWSEALTGEAMIERFLRGDTSFERSPIALVRALLVQTWRPCGSNGRDPTRGWALGTLFPEFDELARPIKRRVNHTAVAALPISFRPALLAGLSRAIAHPATLDAIRDETIFRGRAAFERLCEEARTDVHATGKSHST